MFLPCLFLSVLQEKRTKAVVIGRLGPGDSFGETTVLKHLPMPCSVTTDTQVELGTISTLDVFGNHDVIVLTFT